MDNPYNLNSRCILLPVPDYIIKETNRTTIMATRYKIVKIKLEDYQREIESIKRDYEKAWGIKLSIPDAITIRLKQKEKRKKDEKKEDYNIF